MRRSANGWWDVSERRASARISPSAGLGPVGKSASQSDAARGWQHLGGEQSPWKERMPDPYGNGIMDSSAEKRHEGDRSVPVALKPPPLAAGAEARPGDRATAYVWSSDRGLPPQTCIAIDSSAAVALQGAAGTWRPISVGSSFPMQAGVTRGVGAEPTSGITGCNVKVEMAVVTRHGCGRGHTSKGSCTTGMVSLAPSLRRWVRGDAGNVVNPKAGARRNRLAGEAAEQTAETVRNREGGT